MVRPQRLLVLVVAAATSLAGSLAPSPSGPIASRGDVAITAADVADGSTGTLVTGEAETEEEEQGSRTVHLAATTALSIRLAAPCDGWSGIRHAAAVPSHRAAFLSRGPPLGC